MPDTDAFHVCPAHARRTYARAQRDTSRVPGTRFEVSHLSSTPAPATPLSDHDPTASSKQTEWPIVTTNSEQNEGSMRLRQLVIPLGFGVLGVLSTLPLRSVLVYPPWYEQAFAVGTATSLVSTGVLVALSGLKQSAWKRATSVTISLILGVSAVGPFLWVSSIVVPSVHFEIFGYDPTSSGAVVLMIFVVTSSLLSIPVFLIVYYVEQHSTVHLESILPAGEIGSNRGSMRVLGILTLLSLVLSTCSVGVLYIQYTDPTPPTVGDPPPYSGPDAPAEIQVHEAKARTHAVSHTVTVSLTIDPKGDPVYEGNRQTYQFDMQRDVLLETILTSEGRQNLYTLKTEDATWVWLGGDDSPAPSEMSIQNVRDSSPHIIDLEPYVSGNVTSVSADTVEIRYDGPPPAIWNDPDMEGSRTVVIDRSTGRISSVTDTWITANQTWFRTYRFDTYESTRVDVPETPTRPARYQFADLLNGPIFGDGTLLG